MSLRLSFSPALRMAPRSGAVILLISAAACNHGGREPQAPVTLALTSSSFSAGAMARSSTCDGAGTSPELSWSAPPAGTQSLALVVTDRDSPFGYGFVHWVLYNLPPAARELPAGIAAQAALADGSRQGPNDDDRLGYFAPGPPGKSPPHYVFVLYAVDRKVNLTAASKKQLLAALGGHVLAKGELVGSYRR